MGKEGDEGDDVVSLYGYKLVSLCSFWWYCLPSSPPDFFVVAFTNMPLLTQTAGNDRAGISAALLVRLADASREFVSFDYQLTRVRAEPASECYCRCWKMWGGDWSEGMEGFKGFLSVESVFIKGWLAWLEVWIGM